MAVLLFCLLFTQLDPGGAVVCIAANGRISYSHDCKCEHPGVHSGTGCSACAAESAQAAEAAQSCCKASTSPAPCCRKSADKPAPREKKHCCHNFSIDILASAGLSVPAPALSLLDLQPPALPYSMPAVQSIEESLLYIDRPPPDPEQPQAGLGLLEPVRLLL